MTTYYVNKSGSDSNNGLSAATAFLSMGAGYEAAVSGDDIIVGAGVYYESIPNASKGFPNGIIFKADGLVIMDGMGSLQHGILGTSSNTNFHMVPLSAGSGFIITNYREGIRTGGWPSSNNPQFKSCIFQDNLTGAFVGGRSQDPSMLFEDCAWVRNNTAVRTFEGGPAQYDFRRCTFYGNVLGLWMQIARSVVVDSCVFHPGSISSATLLRLGIGAPLVLRAANHNNYTFTGGAVNRIDNTNYSTLATYVPAINADQSRIDFLEQDSTDHDPQFLDGANNLLRLKGVSASHTLGSGIPNGRQGAYPAGFAVSNNENTADWTTNATLTNVTLNGDKYEITAFGSDGIIETGIFNLGSAQAPGKLWIDQLIKYPLQVIDHDKTDTQPNRLTVEVRGGASAGAVSAAAYQPVDIGGNLSAVIAGPFQYWQVKFTLRSDGVAA